MGRLTRVEITLGLSCLIAAGCGGTPPVQDQATLIQPDNGVTGTTKPTTPSSAGSTAVAGVMRASAKIEPLMLAPATMTGMTGMTGATTAGTTGMTAAAAGASAAGSGATASAAGAGAAGTSASTAGAGNSAGSGGTGTGTGIGAGIAAGSGGDGGGGATTTSPAAGAGGMTAAAPTTGAAGMTAAPTTGAAGMTAAAAGGAGGAQAPANISGSANFSSSASGVNLTVMVSGCQSGKEYPIHIHQGMSCESAMAQGAHWDMTRGENIPNIKCGNRQGATMTTRAKTDASTAWSVGDSTATDVVGHAIVIHDADDPTQRIACGVIVKN